MLDGGHHPDHPAGSATGQPHLVAVNTADAEPTVFVKPAPASDPHRRRAEAELLRTFRHPGVVEFLGLDTSGDGDTLRLARVPDATDLLHHQPLRGSQLVEVFGTLAQTIGELHDAGYVHGNLGAEHVLIDTRMRVVVCGFGNAAPLRTEARPDGLDPSLDTVAIGRLLDRELDRADPNSTDSLSSSLRHIASIADAHQVTNASPASLALRFHQLAGTVPSGENPQGGPPGRFAQLREALEGTSRAVGGLVAAGALVIVGIAVVAALRGSPADNEMPAAADSQLDTPAQPTNSGAPSNTDAARSETAQPDTELILATPSVSSPAVCPTVPDDVASADIDGDGCADPWSASAGVLTAAGERYQLGSASDHVAVGDWDCSGTATPALVRADSGQVFFFDSWPANGAALEAQIAATVPNPTGVSIRAAETDASSPCAQLEVSSSSGTSTIISGDAL